MDRLRNRAPEGRQSARCGIRDARRDGARARSPGGAKGYSPGRKPWEWIVSGIEPRRGDRVRDAGFEMRDAMVRGREAPEGRKDIAQGVSPGNGSSPESSPGGATGCEMRDSRCATRWCAGEKPRRGERI